MLPKRRFWKAQPASQKVSSKRFSTILSPNGVLTTSKSASKTHSERLVRSSKIFVWMGKTSESHDDSMMMWASSLVKERAFQPVLKSVHASPASIVKCMSNGPTRTHIPSHKMIDSMMRMCQSDPTSESQDDDSTMWPSNSQDDDRH